MPTSAADQRQPVVLLPDDLVVQAENVFPNKAGRRRVVLHRVR